MHHRKHVCRCWATMRVRESRRHRATPGVVAQHDTRRHSPTMEHAWWSPSATDHTGASARSSTSRASESRQAREPVVQTDGGPQDGDALGAQTRHRRPDRRCVELPGGAEHLGRGRDEAWAIGARGAQLAKRRWCDDSIASPPRKQRPSPFTIHHACPAVASKWDTLEPRAVDRGVGPQQRRPLMPGSHRRSLSGSAKATGVGSPRAWRHHSKQAPIWHTGPHRHPSSSPAFDQRNSWSHPHSAPTLGRLHSPRERPPACRRAHAVHQVRQLPRRTAARARGSRRSSRRTLWRGLRRQSGSRRGRRHGLARRWRSGRAHRRGRRCGVDPVWLQAEP